SAQPMSTEKFVNMMVKQKNQNLAKTWADEKEKNK
ncbi:uncharacterized protein METZ01_LOCUS393461, partial [marine metagenome]